MKFDENILYLSKRHLERCLEQVATIETGVLVLKISGQGQPVHVDISGLVKSDPAFKALEVDAVFSTASVINYGKAVGWQAPNGSDDLEIGLDTLLQIAELQNGMSGDSLRCWAEALEMDSSQAAISLGITSKEFSDYTKMETVPRMVMLAAIMIERVPSLVLQLKSAAD